MSELAPQAVAATANTATNPELGKQLAGLAHDLSLGRLEQDGIPVDAGIKVLSVTQTRRTSYEDPVGGGRLPAHDRLEIIVNPVGHKPGFHIEGSIVDGLSFNGFVGEDGDFDDSWSDFPTSSDRALTALRHFDSLGHEEVQIGLSYVVTSQTSQSK